MVNNRLWLVFQPTGDRVLIGKRMADPWEAPGGAEEKLADFFDRAGEHALRVGRGIDNFQLVIEDNERVPHMEEG